MPAGDLCLPLVEDDKARYNCWVKDDDFREPVASQDTCGIIFEPQFCWVCIGTWAFGSDFVTRKRAIRWHNFQEEAKAVSQLAGRLLDLSAPNIYDAICNYDLFTEENYRRLMAGFVVPDYLSAFLWVQFCQLSDFYRPGFEICVMEDIPPSEILAWADLGGVTENEAWYDEELTNNRIHRSAVRNP